LARNSSECESGVKFISFIFYDLRQRSPGSSCFLGGRGVVESGINRNVLVLVESDGSISGNVRVVDSTAFLKGGNGIAYIMIIVTYLYIYIYINYKKRYDSCVNFLLRMPYNYFKKNLSLHNICKQ
jgi:hypothetical protein